MWPSVRRFQLLLVLGNGTKKNRAQNHTAAMSRLCCSGRKLLQHYSFIHSSSKLFPTVTSVSFLFYITINVSDRLHEVHQDSSLFSGVECNQRACPQPSNTQPPPPPPPAHWRVCGAMRTCACQTAYQTEHQTERVRGVGDGDELDSTRLT